MAIRNALPFEFPWRWDDIRRFFGKMEDEAVDYLDQRDRDLEDFLATLGGGVPTLFAASANATDKSKSYADVVCSGTDDDVDLNALLTEIGTDGGRLFLSEGDFNITNSIILGYGQSIQGLRDATFLEMGVTGTGVELRDYGFVRDISISGFGGVGSIGVNVSGDNGTVEGCVFTGWETGVRVGGFIEDNSILHNRFYGGKVGVRIVGDHSLIQGNYLNAELRIADGSGSRVLGNRFGPTSTAKIYVDAAATSACFSDNYLNGAGLSRFFDSGTNTMRGTNFSDGGTW